jgi:cytochrome c biogenesis protein CcmG/thiol:disulfide interchange protein DsbE
MSTIVEDRAPAAGRWGRLLFIVPALLFVGVAVFLALGLTRDPGTLPSALIDRPAPDFALPPLEGWDRPALSRADLGGEPVLVNVFASWCVPCRVEHPVLMRLAQQHGITIHGINQKDAPAQARAFLAELGDPYTRIGADRDGRVSIDWGVYGVPETFVVDGEGRIRYRHVGPLQGRDVEATILPLLERLRG